MAKYIKPEMLNLVWASDALPEDRPSPDANGEFSGVGITVDVAEGWTQIKPPYEVENWIQNQQSQFNAYINQLGIPEWDSATEYQANKSYIQGSDNRIYKCILTHTDRNPASGNPTYWELFEGNRQATTDARGTVELASEAEMTAGTSDTVAVTPNKLRFGVSFLAASRGYLALPSWLGGFIIQWGRDGVTGENPQSFTYPTPFLEEVYVLVAGDLSNAVLTSSTEANPFIARTTDNSTFQAKVSSGGTTGDLFGWIAIGK